MQALSSKYPLKKVILIHALYRYTVMVTMVIMVTAIDTHGSWHMNLASLLLGISKALKACMEGIFCKVKAATNVLSFLCLQAKYTCGAIKATSTQVVVKYTIWAMYETKNEPFVDFLILVCLTIGEKGKFLVDGYQAVRE